MHALVAAVLLWVAKLEKFADSPLEEDGFELVVPDFRDTFLLYRFRAANWPGATAGFDDR
jgi:hypothetical protein